MRKNVKNESESEQGQRHDEGYKKILSDRESFLHFLKKYIAAPWTANILVDDLVRIDKSFIGDEYRRKDCDLIYKLKMGGTDMYFYVLLEMQSQVDHTMPFRLLCYMVELLSDIFKNTDEAVRERKGFRLPAIVPIVLYNGSDNWTAVRNYREYTENHVAFGDSIIDFHYFLFDLKRTDEGMILSSKKLLDIIFSLDKARFEKNSSLKIAGRLSELKPKLTKDDLSTLSGWVEYVLHKGTMSPEFEKALKQILKRKGDVTTMKHALELLRDEWEEGGIAKGMEKGIAKGRKEGRKEGWKEGIAEERRKNAKAMKAEGIDVSVIAQITSLTAEEIAQL